MRYVDPDGLEIQDENGAEITLSIIQGYIFVFCKACKEDSQQLANVQELVDMANLTGNLQAVATLFAMQESRTIFHIDFDRTTDPTDPNNPRGRSVHRPHSSMDDGNQALFWDSQKRFFAGTPDIRGEGENVYYRESTITFYLKELGKYSGVAFAAEFLKDLVHEASHGLDRNQVREAKAGKSETIPSGSNFYTNYHPKYMIDNDKIVRDEIMANGFPHANDYYHTKRLVEGYFRGEGGCYVPNF